MLLLASLTDYMILTSMLLVMLGLARLAYGGGAS